MSELPSSLFSLARLCTLYETCEKCRFFKTLKEVGLDTEYYRHYYIGLCNACNLLILREKYEKPPSQDVWVATKRGGRRIAE